MKALVYIFTITIALFTGFLMSNTYFRAHYLGIGQKINFTLTLREQECNFGECTLTFSDDFDPQFLYLITWNKNPMPLNAPAKALMVKNEFGQLCLIELHSGLIKEDFSHISFCNKVIKQTEDEWNKLKQRPAHN